MNKNINIEKEIEFDLDYHLDYDLYLKGYSKCSIRGNTTLNIFRAFDYTKDIGLPFNNFITITFNKKSKIYPNIVFSKIRNVINRWIKTKGKKNPAYAISPTWVFVFENKAGRIHVHWLIHIPEDLRDTFIKKVTKSLERYQQVPVKDNQLDFQIVNPYEDKTIANYICKGVHPKFIGFFHLNKRASFQGYIDWQRGRVSTNLGRVAIKKSGFNASLQRHEWIQLHPHIAEKWIIPEDWDINEVVPQLTGAKKFGGYKELWRRLISETSYYNKQYTVKDDSYKKNMPKAYINQIINLRRIEQQLNYTI